MAHLKHIFSKSILSQIRCGVKVSLGNAEAGKKAKGRKGLSFANLSAKARQWRRLRPTRGREALGALDLPFVRQSLNGELTVIGIDFDADAASAGRGARK